MEFENSDITLRHEPAKTTTTTANNVNYASEVSVRISESKSPPSKSASPDHHHHHLHNNPVLRRSLCSKPKSRFAAQSYNNPLDHPTIFEDNKVFTPKSPLIMPSPRLVAAEDDEDEIIYKKVESTKWKRNRVTLKTVIEVVLFVFIMVLLISSLTVEKLINTTTWGLSVWKWCLLVLVTFCGLLVSYWFVNMFVFLIELNFLLKKKVLYFVHGLKKSLQVLIWLGLVLLTWVLLIINHGVQRSKLTTRILDGVTWTLVSLLIGAFLWFLKTLSLKILASSFHVKSFFDRIQESLFHQYVLQVLSGRPMIEEAERVGRSPSSGRFSFRSTNAKGNKVKKKEVNIDVAKLHKMKQDKVSTWTMKILVDAVTNSRLSTISNVLDETFYNGGIEQTDNEITNEMEAIAAAFHIFRNVAGSNCQYIDEDDLRRFMIKEEVNLVFPLFDGAETGHIDRKALTNWVLKVYQERKALAHALSDTKTAVKQLNKLVTGILVIVTIVIWLLLMEIATTKVLLVLSSQLVLVAFMFGNTCKNIFEAIIFVFVMHPFDVGDRCVIDGVQLLVEEMNILNTVFLKLNNEKVYYPNSVLATKPISNYYRSPDMADTVEFSIDFMTPVEKIGALQERIKRYLEKNAQHWHPNHSVVVKEIEDVNKIKMALYLTHTMNFQEWGVKNKRRSELVMEMKKILEELNIRYNLLPQSVHVTHIGQDSDVLRR